MQDKTEDKSGVRSFIVLMDKNKDTQWVEDGEFVNNPLPTKIAYDTGTEATFKFFAKITSLAVVNEVESIITSASGAKRFIVTGYRFHANPFDLVTRVVEVTA